MKSRLVLVAGVLSLLACLNTWAQGLVVHEWGTFTSVQGSDGVQLDWRSLLQSDLPKFVYDRSKRGVETQQNWYGEKLGVNARQRMETPVIYFYTDEETTVDVSVKFPQGLITEWYPRVRDFGPQLTPPGKTPLVKDGFVRWGKIKVFPADKNAALQKELLVEDKPSHYWPARETDSAFVRLCNTGVNNVTTYEHEKFLFYRGVGSFSAPLLAKARENNELPLVEVKNTGEQDLSGLIFLTIKDGKGAFVTHDKLEKGATHSVQFTGDIPRLPMEKLVAELKASMIGALIKQGLYQREVEAMVKTWQDSWFQEEGTRVLYLLPQSWTDAALPLTLNPKPKETVRVMVGRAELLTPALEKQVEKSVAALSDSSFEAREQASTELKKLGRFTETALKRVAENSTDPEVKNRAGEILKAMAKVAPR